MKPQSKKLLSLEDASKQILNLIKAVAKINQVKCQLSLQQIKRILDGGEKFQKIHVNKWNAQIAFYPAIEQNYITISTIYYEDCEKYTINIV